MVNKTPIVTAVVLALFAIASPLSQSGGTAYSGTLSRASFNNTKIALAGERLKNRYAARIVQTHRNVVGEEGALKPLVGNTPHNAIDKRQWGVPSKVPVTKTAENEWTVPVSIGTNGQQFTLLLDTGAEALWVPSSSCTADRCTNRNKYDPGASSTSVATGQWFSDTYADGSKVDGPVYNDTITISNFQVTAPFVAAAHVVDTTSRDTADGILGINLYSGFFTALWNQNQQLEPVVGFKLSDPGPEMDIGGGNYDLISGDIELHPVTTRGTWTIGSMSIYLTANQASFAISDNDNAEFDTGSELIIGPVDKVEDIYTKIGGKLYSKQTGEWIYPCNADFSMAFSWNGAHWEISSSNFFFEFAFQDSAGQWCVGVVSSLPIDGFPANTWLVGTPFLTNYYITFNYVTPSVGLAKLKA